MEVDEETKERFQRMDERFDKVDERLAEQFRNVNDQFQRLFDFLDRRFTAIDTRFERLEQKVDRHHDEALMLFDALYKRDEDRQVEYQVIKAALSRVEVSQTSIDLRVAALEAAFRGDHDA